MQSSQTLDANLSKIFLTGSFLDDILTDTSVHAFLTDKSLIALLETHQ
jgi:hypothetical protein